jgi:hypothetical protein
MIMDIVLFQEVTTASNLQALEVIGKKFNGLYVDMDNKEERKYVKDNAQMIGNLLKTLDRARIAKTRDYKTEVEKEAGEIRTRLEAANLPFTLLIDEHKAKRAKSLAAEKAKETAAELVLLIEADHYSAIMMDKIQTIEAAEREQERVANEERIATQAAEKAVQQEKDRQASKNKALELERLQREADKEHVRSTNRQAVVDLMASSELTESQAKMVVTCIAKKLVSAVSIKY